MHMTSCSARRRRIATRIPLSEAPATVVGNRHTAAARSIESLDFPYFSYRNPKLGSKLTPKQASVVPAHIHMTSCSARRRHIVTRIPLSEAPATVVGNRHAAAARSIESLDFPHFSYRNPKLGRSGSRVGAVHSWLDLDNSTLRWGWDSAGCALTLAVG